MIFNTYLSVRYKTKKKQKKIVDCKEKIISLFKFSISFFKHVVSKCFWIWTDSLLKVSFLGKSGVSDHILMRFISVFTKSMEDDCFLHVISQVTKFKKYFMPPHCEKKVQILILY